MERQAKSALITVRTRQVVVMAYTLKEPEVACKDCGTIFTRKSHRTIRCPECRRQYVLKREREYSRERYAELKGTSDPNMPREGVKSSLCDTKTCARCIYSFSLSGTCLPFITPCACRAAPAMPRSKDIITCKRAGEAKRVNTPCACFCVAKR